MKPENFRNGAQVQIKLNARGVLVHPRMVGEVGTLTDVHDLGDGSLVGYVLGWMVRPEHVRSWPREQALTPGLYVDANGDLWVITETRACAVISQSDIEDGVVRQCYLPDGWSIERLTEHLGNPDTRPNWAPLTRVADLPKSSPRRR